MNPGSEAKKRLLWSSYWSGLAVVTFCPIRSEAGKKASKSLGLRFCPTGKPLLFMATRFKRCYMLCEKEELFECFVISITTADKLSVDKGKEH